ncbi:MAG: hypothetical protein EA396_08745 [Anaerolineaceae bacterium]|nr:MAG: hypothetical protein EA396_08745 [Anaerolineaceae bacterium]
MTDLTVNERQLSPTTDGLTFNFALALPGRASSRHTQRAYFRWVDTYLTHNAGMKPMKGAARLARMQMLPLPILQDTLSPQYLRAWLGRLAADGHGKQGIEQARAAIVTLADLLAEAEWLPDHIAAGMSRVRIPRAEDGQRPGRWLSLDQLRVLMRSAVEIAASDGARARNAVLINMLCTMALRREELANARWGDFSVQNERPVMQVRGKGRKVAVVDMPRPVMRALDEWRHHVDPQTNQPALTSAVLRRMWKGGAVAQQALSADGIWFIVKQSAYYAGLGEVAPHDLRRSVAGALEESGVPVETISRLLRHSNLTITERYLSKLPRANKGAVLMSDALGLEDDGDDWPGITPTP